MTAVIEHTKEDPKPAFVADDAFLAAFHAQYSTTLIKKAERFATTIAFRVGNLRAGDPSYLRAVTQSAISDTVIGDVSWDHANKSLEQHLYDVVHYRVRNDRAHEKRFPSERFELRDAATVVGAAVETAMGIDGPTSHQQEAQTAAVAAAAQLRAESEGDADALRVLDAFAQGVTKKVDILHLTDLTNDRYHSAWARLRRRAQDIPNSLWSAVRNRG